ncbi:hypothetical protein [Streptomyces alboflavus]|uniref:hypothetical protein n=1 Tax=Streptomyces alboflavus TaxID=67267 RepID=UPI0004C06378|nr:hypothetical protein [Streptomyces alboflavus]
MTGPEHYRKAQKILSAITTEHGAILVEDGTAEVIAAAQVHATLALAAATALSNPDRGSAVAHINADTCAWREAAGVETPKGGAA